MAGLRQRHRQFAHRKPVVERGPTRPRLFKLDCGVNRPLHGRYRPTEARSWVSMARRPRSVRSEPPPS